MTRGLSRWEISQARSMRREGASIADIAATLRTSCEIVDAVLFFSGRAAVQQAGAAVDPDQEEICNPVAQDRAFIAAMMRAIKAGREHAPIGIDTRPGTDRPIVLTMLPGRSGAGSPAAQCMEHD